MALTPSVCIDAVLEHYPPQDALALVSQLGYRAFEFWKWWDRDLEELLQARERYGLKIAACCTKFISLVDPAARPAYLQGLSESIRAAQLLDCSVLISQVGDFRPGVERQAQHTCLVAGLRAAAELLEGSGVTLAIEPLNERVDHAGYYLVHSEEAFDIVRQVGSPHVKVTFDIYHQQISEGDVITNIERNVTSIAHFHAAGNPGRHELTRGELNYRNIFQAIQGTSFNGYVGLEYWPCDPAEVGLRQVAEWFA